MDYYVYIYLNPQISGTWSFKEISFDYQPIYVGMGVDRRWKEHLRVSDNKKKFESNFTKFNLIKRLINNKTPPIVLKIFENIDKETAKLIEKELISHFGKLIDGSGILTNITDGADETNCNKLGADNPQSKKVYQYSINGSYIKEWNCLREIGRKLNVNYNTIGDNCRGKTKTAYGYQWFYEYKGELINKIIIRENLSRQKCVYKFNINGEFIESYKSLTKAATKNNVNRNNLSHYILYKKLYRNEYYSYDNYFDYVNNSKLDTYHKIELNGEILYLKNSEIMEKFNVSKYYIFEVKRNRIKKPKFKCL